MPDPDKYYRQVEVPSLQVENHHPSVISLNTIFM